VLIVFEGIDGSGKTTQARMLHNALLERGYHVVFLHEPTDSPYGNLIRKKLKSGDYTPMELYELFLKDRMINAGRIRNYISEGKIVIMDRYYISTIAYQGAQGIPISKILNDHSSLPTPNMIFILDIDPKIALSRIKPEDTFEAIDFLEKVREIYLRIPKILASIKCNIYIIDASKEPLKIHREVLEKVLGKLEEVNNA